MTTNVLTRPGDRRIAQSGAFADVTRYLVPLGRLLFVGIFLHSVPAHFSAQGIGYAASSGVPYPGILVPISGILALAGGLSVLLGFHARIGALLLVLFLVPVTLMMHAFWAVPEPAMARMQEAMFWKNLGLLGGALLIAHFGAGPISLDHRREVPRTPRL